MRLRYSAQKCVGVFPSPLLIPEPWPCGRPRAGRVQPNSARTTVPRPGAPPRFRSSAPRGRSQSVTSQPPARLRAGHVPCTGQRGIIKLNAGGAAWADLPTSRFRCGGPRCTYPAAGSPGRMSAAQSGWRWHWRRVPSPPRNALGHCSG